MHKLVVLASLLGVGAVSLPAIAQTQPAAAETPVEMAQTPLPNIVGVATGNPDFSTLVKAVQTAGLANTLAGSGPYTVFAPTNDAFNALPAGTVDRLLRPENRGILIDILKYHVVPGRVPSTNLRTGGLDTLNGGLAVNVSPDRVIVNDARVITPNVPASNGVVHAIDRVLIPIAVREQLMQGTPIRGLW